MNEWLIDEQWWYWYARYHWLITKQLGWIHRVDGERLIHSCGVSLVLASLQHHQQHQHHHDGMYWLITNQLAIPSLSHTHAHTNATWRWWAAPLVQRWSLELGATIRTRHARSPRARCCSLSWYCGLRIRISSRFNHRWCWICCCCLSRYLLEISS